MDRITCWQFYWRITNTINKSNSNTRQYSLNCPLRTLNLWLTQTHELYSPHGARAIVIVHSGFQPIWTLPGPLCEIKYNSMSLKDKIRSLISNFKMLSEQEIELIVETTIVDEFQKGTLLLKEGQIPSKCYMVVEGCVREYLIKDGEEVSTAFFTEGDTFTPPALKGQPSNHYWECVEDCILTISNKNYEEELRATIPRLDSVFQEIAIDKINKLKDDWSQFVSSSPEERYLNLLKTRPHLLDRVSHHQIASYLGIKPQSLSRIRKRIIDQQKRWSEDTWLIFEIFTGQTKGLLFIEFEWNVK